jgi:regulator of sigma E protease
MLIFVSILVLGVLVFVHELGHFLLAKLNGIAVIEFSIGFGKKLLRKRVGGTIYSIGMIPLGGYVRMAGDDPRDLQRPADGEKGVDAQHSSRESDEDPEEAYLKLMLMGDPNRWFLNKGFFAKSSVVIAGPGFNLLFAVFLSIFAIYLYGLPLPVDKPIIGDVLPGYPAEKATLRAKDVVTKMDGKVVTTWTEFAKTVADSGGNEMTLSVDRINPEAPEGVEHLELKVKATSDVDELAVLEGTTHKKTFKIGVVPDAPRKEVEFSKAVEAGTLYVFDLSRVVVRGLVGMVQGAVSTKNIAGPIFIFKEAANSAKKGLENLFNFMIFLSVSLAILNLLPIPILDGGHLLFFVIEALKGSPVSLRIQEFANQVGMFILLMLMVFAVGNDIAKLIGTHF